MPREISAPRPGAAKSFPLKVHASVAFDLHVYCETLPAQWTRVINKAVRELIDRTLDDNAGFREQFERTKGRLLDDERRRRAAEGRDMLRLLKKPRTATKGRRETRRPNNPSNS
jgi:hypothetical protein